ncbi:MAG TPA: hypothetical protein VGM07_08960 [Stellaceae bacterium]|jgi:hypothetical protein
MNCCPCPTLQWREFSRIEPYPTLPGDPERAFGDFSTGFCTTKNPKDYLPFFGGEGAEGFGGGGIVMLVRGSALSPTM